MRPLGGAGRWTGALWACGVRHAVVCGGLPSLRRAFLVLLRLPRSCRPRAMPFVLSPPPAAPLLACRPLPPSWVAGCTHGVRSCAAGSSRTCVLRVPSPSPPSPSRSPPFTMRLAPRHPVISRRAARPASSRSRSPRTPLFRSPSPAHRNRSSPPPPPPAPPATASPRARLPGRSSSSASCTSPPFSTTRRRTCSCVLVAILVAARVVAVQLRDDATRCDQHAQAQDSTQHTAQRRQSQSHVVRVACGLLAAPFARAP